MYFYLFMFRNIFSHDHHCKTKSELIGTIKYGQDAKLWQMGLHGHQHISQDKVLNDKSLG